MIEHIRFSKVRWNLPLMLYLVIVPVFYGLYLFYLVYKENLAFNLLLEQDPNLAFGLIHNLVMVILGYLFFQENSKEKSKLQWELVIVILMQQIVSLNYAGIALSSLYLISSGKPSFSKKTGSLRRSKNILFAIGCFMMSFLVFLMQWILK